MKKLLTLILIFLSVYSQAQTPAVDKVLQLKSGQNISLDKIFNDSSSLVGRGLYVVPKGTSGSVKDTVMISQGLLDSITAGFLKEPALGNPGTNGYVLSKTTAGVVSWIPPGGGGDVYLANNNTFTGANIFSTNTNTFTGFTNSDGGIISSEILTTLNWTSTDWVGDFTVGFDHTTGNTTVLSNTQTASVGASYILVLTVTLRTAGSFVVSFGGVTLPATSTTQTYAFLASSTGNFTVTPTSDFDGTIVFSLKTVSSSTANLVFKSSAGTIQNEIRISSTGTSIFTGIGAGRRNISTAGSNTVYGHQAFLYNVNGTNNTVMGTYAVGASSRSSQLTVFGNSGLSQYLSGDQMTAIGSMSLYNQLSGSGVTALGYNSGRRIADNTTASTIQNNSVFIGHDARPLADNQTNQNVYGYGAVGNGSNTNTFGNTSIIGNYFFGQHFLGGYGTGSTYTGTANKYLAVTTTGAMIVADGAGGGDAYLANTQTFTAQQTVQGAATAGGGQLLAESGTTATGTDWTGTSLILGYTHTPGTANPLTAAFTVATGTYYRIVVTTTGTTGSISFTMGGYTSSTINFGSSLDVSPKTSSTAALVITPTSAFDGVVTVSVKVINAASTANWIFKNSAGTTTDEIRASVNQSNTFKGRNSGGYITTGISNTAEGDESMKFTTSGNYNTAIGSVALFNNNTGSNNFAGGFSALYSNTTGGQNVVFGDQAAYSNTTGMANTVAGYKAANGWTTGSSNAAYGQDAGRFQTDGTTPAVLVNNSVFIGAKTKALGDNQTNQNVFGYDATGAGSNSTVIGNASITSIKLNGALTLPHSTYSAAGGLLKAAITTGAITVATGTDIAAYSVSGETPSGTINGVNTTFTLASTPIAGTVKIFLRGLRMKLTNDYTISGSTITMITIPETGDDLLIDYSK